MQKIPNEVLCPNISHTNHLGPSKLSNVFDLLSTHSSPAILIHSAVCLLTILIGIVENKSIVNMVDRDPFLRIYNDLWIVILPISWPIQKYIRIYLIKFYFEQLKIVIFLYFFHCVTCSFSSLYSFLSFYVK